MFGGEGRLQETIANALKVVDADLYVVLTSCASEIIGDDVEEIVKSFRSADRPVICAATPGFKGSNYLGHEWVVQAIIEQYLTAFPAKVRGLVKSGACRIMTWAGEPERVGKAVAELGLIPNTIFGYGRGLGNIDALPQAKFNLLVSPWLGLANMRLLEAKFGTPFLHYPTLPIGADETSKFFRAASASSPISTGKGWKS